MHSPQLCHSTSQPAPPPQRSNSIIATSANVTALNRFDNHCHPYISASPHPLPFHGFPRLNRLFLQDLTIHNRGPHRNLIRR